MGVFARNATAYRPPLRHCPLVEETDLTVHREAKMQVQRQFITVTDRRLVIEVPESFLNHRVEVITLTVDDEAPPVQEAKRRPHPSIAGKGRTLGDLVSPIMDEGDWEHLK